MKKLDYDITVIGSGLSSYACLKYLILNKAHIGNKICVIAGDININKNHINSEITTYLKNSHRVIYDANNINEIDTEYLNYSYRSNKNIISIKSIGGLGKYWGGGFFPKLVLGDKNDIDSLILNNFDYVCNKSNSNLIKGKNKTAYAKEIECCFMRSSYLNKIGNYEILNPGKEIRILCKKNNIDFIINTSVNKLSYIQSNKYISIVCYDKSVIESGLIFLGAGVIGTPEILFRSNILKKSRITINDHLLYRIPILRPLGFIKYFYRYLTNRRGKVNHSISSLKQAFKLNISGRTLFLGLYTLDISRIKVNLFLELLCKMEVIIFSQIYVGSEKGSYSCDCSIDLKNNAKLTNYKYLSFNEWIHILLFFIKSLMIPIPYKFRLPFGSSYHLHGSLTNKIGAIKNFQQDDQRIIIIDSSVLKEIGPEPTSYRIIKNTISIVSKSMRFNSQ